MTPRYRWHPWAMLAPTLVLLGVFFVVPIGVAAYQSLFAWDLLTPPVYVGSQNFHTLLAHGELFRVALRTLTYSAIVVSGTMSLGLALALLLDRPGRVFAFVRGCVFSAYVVSWVAVALLWMWLLDGNAGLLGRLWAWLVGGNAPLLGRALRALGAQPMSLLGNVNTALPTLAVVGIWKLTGYAMIVFLAGLQSVPSSLVEAAALDGAGPWARFRHVTMPLLAPTAAFVATTSLVTSFQAFDVVRLMTQGGPARATELFVYAIYQQVFLNLSVGRASALTVVFFVLLFAVAALQLRAWRAKARLEP
jgi:ABC-type sugar transport system permease subunit